MPYVKQITTYEEIVDLLRRTTVAQGVTETIEDPAQARRLAVLLISARRAASQPSISSPHASRKAHAR